MGGLFSTSYDVQKVGHTVKNASRRSASSEIKTTEVGNNVFAKSDIDIIGPIEGVKKEEGGGGKSVRIDESKTEVFEDVEVRKEPEAPPIDEEERKKQEDLMMAMVRGEIHPRDSISAEPTVPETEPQQVVKLVNSSIEITEEKLCEDKEATEIQEAIGKQVEEAKPETHSATAEELPKPAEDHVKVEKETATEESKPTEPVENVKSTALADIQSVEEATKNLKERIINFNGVTKNIEYEGLHQAIVNNMLKLDDVNCDTDELSAERKRVMKVLQQCMESLERKIEPVKNVESDSE